MDKSNFLPYLLPLISIIAITVIAFSKPEITGLAVANDKEIVESKVRIFLDKDSMLPKESEVLVILDGKEGKMPLTQFIEKANGFKELKGGEITEISFKGEGYVGENVYDVNLNEFDLGLVDKKDEHELIIKVLYNNQVLLENKKIIEGNIK